MKFNIGILLILILLSVISFSNSNRVLNKDLFVDKELLRESISPALQEINEYTLRDLKPNSYYEIRISYPSTNPANFDIKFVANPNSVSPSPKGRTLLNTEKIMFQTNELAQIVGIQPSDNEGNYKVQVQASYDSVSTNPSSTTRKIFYNIILENLLYGAPKDVIFIVILIVIGLFFILTIFIPQILPFLLGFNSSSQKKKSGSSSKIQ